MKPSADLGLTAPPFGCTVMRRSVDDALIGLPLDVIAPTGSAATRIAELAPRVRWLPRWPALTSEERRHESAFAELIEGNLRDFVIVFCDLAFDADLGCHVFEVDAAKRLYAPYENDPRVRAVANHALHPAGVAIARLAFLDILDGLAQLPVDAPRRAVFVTNGGCASGKGSLVQMVRSLRDNAFDFGAVWDAAGEGDAQENEWILQAIRERSLTVVFGFVENDPTRTYRAVLDRAIQTGRIVDPLTFTRSYVRGQQARTLNVVRLVELAGSPQARFRRRPKNEASFGMPSISLSRGLRCSLSRAGPTGSWVLS